MSKKEFFTITPLDDGTYKITYNSDTRRMLDPEELRELANSDQMRILATQNQIFEGNFGLASLFLGKSSNIEYAIKQAEALKQV